MLITKLEGIVLSKALFKERNLIANILLRDGQKCSVLFYGGAGGGKNKKGGLIEVGHLLQIELRPSGSLGKGQYLAVAKEWMPLWSPDRIRYFYPAYLLCCLFLELVEKTSPENDPSSPQKEQMVEQKGGTFRVLSNALFFLNQDLLNSKIEQNSSRLDLHLAIFLGKILAELGLYPNYQECLFCGFDFFGHSQIAPSLSGPFFIDRGGLSCALCQKQSPHSVEMNWPYFFYGIWHQKYPDLLNSWGAEESRIFNRSDFKIMSQMLLKYFNYHTNVTGPSMRTFLASSISIQALEVQA